MKAGHLAPLPRIREEAPAIEAGEAPREELQDETGSDPESSKRDTISDLLMGSSSSSSSSAAQSQRKEATKRDQGEELEDKPAKEIKLDADTPIEEPVKKGLRRIQEVHRPHRLQVCLRQSLQARLQEMTRKIIKMKMKVIVKMNFGKPQSSEMKNGR